MIRTPNNAPACWYRVSVKLLIIQDGQVLLVKEGSYKWDFPGGGLEHGEDNFTALKRECMEELGVPLASCEPLPTFIGQSYDPVNDRPVLVLYYRGQLDNNSFKLEPPVTDIAFKSVDDLQVSDFEPYLAAYFDNLVTALPT